MEFHLLSFYTQGDKATLMTELQRSVQAQQTAERSVGDLNATLAALQGELENAQRRLAETTNTLTQTRASGEAAAAAAAAQLAAIQAELEGRIAGLERQLEGTREHGEMLGSQLQLQQDENGELRGDLESAQQQIAALMTRLRCAEVAVAGLQEALREEQQARADERDAALAQLDGMRQKAASDLSVKDAIIAAIKIEKAQLEARLSADKTQLNKDIVALQLREGELVGNVTSLEKELRVSRDEYAQLLKKKEQLDIERFNLISVAVKCQEAQTKVCKVGWTE